MAVNTNAKSISEDLLSLKSNYANDNIDWVRFVYDHYNNIMSQCTYIAIDRSSLYWREYRLEDFLREKGYDPSVAWIVIHINQMKSHFDFKDCDSILLPDMAQLRALWQSFMQYRSHIKACRR